MHKINDKKILQNNLLNKFKKYIFQKIIFLRISKKIIKNNFE